MVLNLRWGTGAWVQDRHHFPSIDPHLCFEFLQFFLFIMDPWFNISDKNYIISAKSLRNKHVYMYVVIFCQIFLILHDKINNYFIFFSKYWNLTQQNYCEIILNQDESGNPVWRYWSYFRFIWLLWESYQKLNFLKVNNTTIFSLSLLSLSIFFFREGILFWAILLC